jgi:signal transduction histidine kinase
MHLVRAPLSMAASRLPEARNMQRLPIPTRRSTALRYGAAVVCVALGLAVRATFASVLQGELPFVSFFAATAAAAWFGGLGPSLLSTALGFVVGMLFIARPDHPWWTATPHNFAVATTYLVGALTIVIISVAMHRARQRAIDRQIELEREMRERIQAEEALRKAHDELEARVQERTAELARSNAELQQFAYVASHDLQEPLRMVSNFTQLLAERYDAKLDNDGREFIAFAVEGATRMQTLVQDLLALSRVGTRGKNLEVVRLAEAVDRAVANLEFAIQENGALVSHDELPEVMADSSQMMQLFQNLIGNGIKFKGAEPPRVHISAVRNGKEWTFSVRDNGIGFEPQYAERIFAVFQRLHSRDEYQGNGIGLSICRKIVERHQGRIWAESTPGSGTTFHFTMPAAGVPEVRPKQGGAA